MEPRLDVSAGTRFTYETKRHAFDHFVDRGTEHDPVFPPVTLRNHWTSWTPRIGAEIHLAPVVMLYTSISQGFRSGGFNGRPLGTDALLAYAPEKLTTYEVGLKAELAQRRLRLDVAAFYSRYRDIQLTLTTVSAAGAPVVITGNAGAARLHGLEMELTAALPHDLLWQTSLGYLDNRYTELRQGVSVPQNGRLPVSPRLTIDTSVECGLRLGASRQARARIEYAYTSAYNYLFDNPPLSWQGAFGLLNARVAYGPDTSDWELAAYVKNATDRLHSAFREDILSSFGTAIVWPARPREWGLELQFRW